MDRASLDRALVFVPCSTGQARALWQGESLATVQAFTVNPQLLAGLDGVHDTEDAEHACAQLASLWGLARHGERLVLVAQVAAGSLGGSDDPESHNTEAHNGGVELGALTRQQVSSFFTDDPANPDPERIAPLVKGLDVDACWELGEVQQLLRTADLLWHSVEELAVLGEDV